MVAGSVAGREWARNSEHGTRASGALLRGTERMFGKSQPTGALGWGALAAAGWPAPAAVLLHNRDSPRDKTFPGDNSPVRDEAAEMNSRTKGVAISTIGIFSLGNYARVRHPTEAAR